MRTTRDQSRLERKLTGVKPRVLSTIGESEGATFAAASGPRTPREPSMRVRENDAIALIEDEGD